MNNTAGGNGHAGHVTGMIMMEHTMSPYLFGNMKDFFLLFREARIKTGGHLAAAIIVSIIFTMLMTLFSFYVKKHIEMKSAMSPERFTLLKLAATAVFSLRMFFHYVAMVLVMSMNIWIILAVTLGHALGFILFHVVFPNKSSVHPSDDD